ncbi:MAG: aminoglycoside phosphotransferase family protein [Bacteroidetes bacterium]|nr:aminoglycoside phosphotransferase family protein [Bacteroidota bacterium]
MDKTLLHILSQFVDDAEGTTFTPVSNGHIHETYLCDNHKKYVLQKVNNQVFPDIPALMKNISRVTLHLKDKGMDYALQIPSVIPDKKGVPYIIDEQGNYWRLFSYIHESQAYNKPATTDMAAEGGRAFGLFLKALSDLDPGELIVTLPCFHDVNQRWENYLHAREKAPPEKFKEAKEETDLAEAHYTGMNKYFSIISDGSVPLRVTHNDTKFNNILFDSHQQAVSVIDLDTVMSGLALFDFGDAIRTLCNTADEDERDTCRVHFDMRLFDSFSKGYLSACGTILTTEEIRHLAFSPLYITYLQGLRFLTDHFDGDKYYRVGYFGHNLVRAAVQFMLLRQMVDKQDVMQEHLNEIIHSLRGYENPVRGLKP